MLILRLEIWVKFMTLNISKKIVANINVLKLIVTYVVFIR